MPAGSLVPTVDTSSPASLMKAGGKASGDLLNMGSDTTGKGLAALQPVIAQLMKLIKGDQGEVDTAIAPQIKGIMDTYNAGRRSTAQFTPRGGGQASAISDSYGRESSDISSARSTARTSAVSQLSQIGLGEASIGTEQTGQGLAGIMQLLQVAITEKGNTQAMWGDIGKGAGMILAGLLL